MLHSSKLARPESHTRENGMCPDCIIFCNRRLWRPIGRCIDTSDSFARAARGPSRQVLTLRPWFPVFTWRAEVGMSFSRLSCLSLSAAS